MAQLPDYIQTVTRVMDSTAVTDASNSTTTFVECRGAKSVAFVIRASNAEDSDTLVTPTLTGKVASDADDITAVALSLTATNKLGLIAGTLPAATIVGSQGTIVTLFPEGLGTEVSGNVVGSRIACYSVGLVLNASAGLTVSGVVVDAIVVWN